MDSKVRLKKTVFSTMRFVLGKSTSGCCAILLKHWLQLPKSSKGCACSDPIINRNCNGCLIPCLWVNKLKHKTQRSSVSKAPVEVLNINSYGMEDLENTLVLTGMISSLNLPAAVAAAAFLCESTWQYDSDILASGDKINGFI